MSHKILIDITHPAHYHFFKNAASIWEEKGNDVKFVARDKDIILQLLDNTDIQYTCLSRSKQGIWGLFRELIAHEYKLYKLIQEYKPDIMLEIAGTFIVHAGYVTNTPTFVFYDTEHARLSNLISYPFATKIITPDCYEGEEGDKHLRYKGYQELAYLHPNYYQPDQDVVSELGLNKNEPYFVLRFVSWQASHDIGHSGYSLEGKINLAHYLDKFGTVLISSEDDLPDSIKKFQYNLPPQKMHDVLAYATLFIGEGGTMATEAALLGTPSIFVSTLEAGTWKNLRDQYGLLYYFNNPSQAMNKINEILKTQNIRKVWQNRRQKMLQEKIDVTQYMVNLIEAYCQNSN